MKDLLPQKLQEQVRVAMNAAYNGSNASYAKSQLEALARELHETHPSAAASLREGLDDTLTLMRLRVPEALCKTLCTTNLIESLNSHIRHVSRNVTHYRSGTMALRWTAVSLLNAERGFWSSPALVDS